MASECALMGSGRRPYVVPSLLALAVGSSATLPPRILDGQTRRRVPGLGPIEDRLLLLAV